MTFERIDENTREFVEDKVKYIVKRRDAVDLWDIKTTVGPVPTVLQGAFTTADHAKNHIVNYLAAKKKD